MRSSYDSSTTRYISAFASLGGLKTKDVIVYFTDQHSCGSGGCTTLILAPSGHSYRVVTSITIGWPPIRVLASKSNGWHDISLWVQGGGIQPGYEATLSFDGVSYPSNPSVLPARRAENKAGRKDSDFCNGSGKTLVLKVMKFAGGPPLPATKFGREDSRYRCNILQIGDSWRGRDARNLSGNLRSIPGENLTGN